VDFRGVAIGQKERRYLSFSLFFAIFFIVLDFPSYFALET